MEKSEWLFIMLLRRKFKRNKIFFLHFATIMFHDETA